MGKKERSGGMDTFARELAYASITFIRQKYGSAEVLVAQLGEPEDETESVDSNRQTQSVSEETLSAKVPRPQSETT